MKLSAATGYAITACSLLGAAGDRPVSCSNLANQGQMPGRFLPQVLGELAKSGIVRSFRGGGGGFLLARPADKVSLLEIIEAVDGPLPVNKLSDFRHLPGRSAEQVTSLLSEITDQARCRLGSITLAYLLDETAGKTRRPSSSGRREASGS